MALDDNFVRSCLQCSRELLPCTRHQTPCMETFTNQCKTKRNRTLERIYNSLVHYRLGIYQQNDDSDFIVQKALRVVQFANKKDERQWLLSAPSLEDKLIGVYDTVQRDDSPTHIVLCIYFAIEVEIDWMQLIT